MKELKRTRASSRRLQRLYDTGKYTCSHRRYSARAFDKFHASCGSLPIGRDFLEVKLIRKNPKLL